MRSPKAGEILVVALALLLIPADALAYLDPGSSSLALQLLLAGLFAALFAFKTFFQRIKAFVRGVLSRPPAAPTAPKQDEPPKP